ncbi:MAG: hydantoinase/oxoprolinase family protein [Betaproteobacteria bacterium]|nr:MAG: hydantoinase/oxoprolinase family protein [Betaproteobacteria bacterium]
MIEIGVDIGGTFTDIVLLRDGEQLHRTKVPSTKADPIAGVRQGVEKILAATQVSPADVSRFVHGSTVAINALLQQKGSVTGLLMTRGFEDTLEIGRQKRSRMYDLFLRPETPTFMAPRHRRFGISERVAADGTIVLPLAEGEVHETCECLVDELGATAISVCYLFSFRNPLHEMRTREIITGMYPNVQVSLSCEVDPTFREYERCVVTTLDAYLQGAVGDYLERLGHALHVLGFRANLQVMQSRGGITTADTVARRPVSLLLSGLAAGVVGSQFVGVRAGCNEVISLDMGGTSCDIALISAGKALVANESRVAGLPLRAQMIDVNTIGAGGGSIAWLDDAGGLRVGPQSAGADPGPACYSRGGHEPTVTDASLLLGYLNPANFADGELSLDVDSAKKAIARIGERLGLDPVRTAAGIHRIVNSKMADEVRRVSVQRGYDPRNFSLLVLGGAGPLHGGAVALELGMPRVLVPEAPGVLSAFGLLVANIEHDQSETFAARTDELDPGSLEDTLERLNARGKEKMRRDGVPVDKVEIHEYADMRYVGQSYELTVALSKEDRLQRAVAAFHTLHRTLYGHSDPGRIVEFVNLRTVHVHRLPPPPLRSGDVSVARGARASRSAYFESLNKYVDTPVHDRACLRPGTVVVGPAIVEQADTTLVVYPGQTARVLPEGSIMLEVEPHGG